jgi:superkiller protein 3
MKTHKVNSIKPFLFISVLLISNSYLFSQEDRYSNQYYQVQIALNEGDAARGDSLVYSLVQEFPDSARAWYLKSQVERQLVHYKDALASAHRALGLDPGNASVYYLVAGIYDDLQRYDRCISYCDSILQGDSLHFFASLMKARAQVKDGDYEKALGIYLSLNERDSMNPAFMKQIGSLYSRIDSLNDAISWYSRAIELDSMDISSYVYLGNLFVRSEQYETGKPVLARAISIDSTNSWLYRFRGSLNIMDASLEDAESDFRKSIALGDSSAFAFRHLGLSLYKQSKYSEALPVYKQTVKLDPEDAQAWYYLGFCYKWQEDMATAIECMEKSLKLSVSPGISDVYNGLAQFHAINREYDSAMLFYSRAYEWNKKDPVPLAQLGMLVEQTGGDKEEAKRYYESYLDEAGLEDIYLMRYVGERLQVINEELFMEGKLLKETNK